MWYKIYADGTEMDVVFAASPQEAVKTVKANNTDVDFSNIHWTYKAI